MPDLAQSIARRFEVRDLHLPAVVACAGALGISVLAGMGLLRGFHARLAERHPGVVSTSTGNARHLPPEPRLQSNPPADFARFKAEQEERLSTYGWVDRSHGVVHLPVERAMELILKRGLPPGNAQPRTPEEMRQGRVKGEAR